MQLYCYSKPCMHAGHRFSDDVALCRAEDADGALDRFRTVFPDATEGDVSLVEFTEPVVRLVG